MLSPKLSCLAAVLVILFSAAATSSAQLQGVVSAVQHAGIMVTSGAQPEFFIFKCGNAEEHFDGTSETMLAQGGYEQGEPITGLHYLRPKLTVNGAPWSPADAKLLADQFHGGPTSQYYLFKTIEGQLFILPKEGETAVVRVDYKLKNGRTVTVWMRK
ncbi:MAG TPA: hypothetical protein VGM54_12225 [Chthoniobacter sp.]